MEVARDTTEWSITEVYDPLYRKVNKAKDSLTQRYKSAPSASDSQPQTIEPGIFNTFSHINSCIGNLEEMFRTRMIVHEEEIIQIAHSQLRKIQAEARKAVQKYSQLIRDRNLSVELLDLRYQVLYYQKKAGQMFEENKLLKEKIKQLNQQLLSRKIGQESDHVALQNISRKYLKEKTLKHKILQSLNFRRDNDNTTSLTNNKLLALTKHINPQTSMSKDEGRKLRGTGTSELGSLFRTGSESKGRSFHIKSKKPNLHICTTPL